MFVQEISHLKYCQTVKPYVQGHMFLFLVQIFYSVVVSFLGVFYCEKLGKNFSGDLIMGLQFGHAFYIQNRKHWSFNTGCFFLMGVLGI